MGRQRQREPARGSVGQRAAATDHDQTRIGRPAPCGSAARRTTTEAHEVTALATATTETRLRAWNLKHAKKPTYRLRCLTT
jgi:hypothetical protein